MPAGKIAQGILLAGTLLVVGCAARRPASDQIHETKTFWNGCTETVPANPDGFQHFVCIDVNKHRWEVLLRREGK